jgi:hypothetical protein
VAQRGQGQAQHTQLQGAVLKDGQLQGANLASASLQGADLSSAELQGANLSYAKLQGATLSGAQFQGADLRFARLQGANLEGAQLQDADLEGAEGTALSAAEIWLVKFPPALAEQRPVPIGLGKIKVSAPTAKTRAQLKQAIETAISDPELRGVVMARLYNILTDEPSNWDDAENWEHYLRSVMAPTPLELARFHAKLACDDLDGTIAAAMAARAKDFEAGHFGAGYAGPLAEALLDETCKGGKALTAETRTSLQTIAAGEPSS